MDSTDLSKSQGQEAATVQAIVHANETSSAAAKGTKNTIQEIHLAPGRDTKAQARGVTFSDLLPSEEITNALKELGYEQPTPIQKMSIPPLMKGRDLLGQAQTGTGKTAAFALPILSKIELHKTKPQALILTPTRELAIQVSEAFQKYASHIKGFKVLPIYGGQGYTSQLKALERGVHVVVGTPGRVMDHIRKGKLKLKHTTQFVIDEADEMLKMGFLEDVEWTLDQLPSKIQIALFSATFPRAIQRISNNYLNDPEIIKIKSTSTTADTVRQRYWTIRKVHKLDALTRILDTENFDASIIFVRTKKSTVELADKLKARGYATEALNGDMPQRQRERTVKRLKAGTLDILVATDVAARGLDVERISHVINYDIPFDTDSYVHRIGRTGRAGKTGEAILFVSPREQRMLRTIEKATKRKIEPLTLPSIEDVREKKRGSFKEKLLTKLKSGEDFSYYTELIQEFAKEHEMPLEQVAGCLAKGLDYQPPATSSTDDYDSSEEPRRRKFSGRSGRGGGGFKKRRTPSRNSSGSSSRDSSRKKRDSKGGRSFSKGGAKKGGAKRGSSGRSSSGSSSGRSSDRGQSNGAGRSYKSKKSGSSSYRGR